MKNMTDMIFVIDRSGSMSGLERDTIGGFNSLIEKQKKEDGDATVTTYLFDHEYEVIHDRFGLKQIGAMTDREYYVRGSTALLDALGSAIQKEINVMKHLPESERAEKVIFVIITDGYENSSMEYSYKDIKRLVEQQKERYGWEFMFLGADIDAIGEAGKIGIAPTRAATFCHDSVGTAINFAAVSDAVCAMRSPEGMPEACYEWKAEIEKDYKKRGRR